MTEADWLACEEPVQMLWLLRGRASDRKFRLFAVACCRRILHLSCDERCREAVEAAEQFAEGEVGADVLGAAFASVVYTLSHRRKAERWARDMTKAAVKDGCRRGAADAAVQAATNAVAAAGWAACAAFEAAAPTRRGKAYQDAWAEVNESSRRAERAVQAALLRDVFGTPFRPVRFDPGWRTPNVVDLARTVYEERELPSGELDRTRLAVLADALMDAGCDDEDILTHCRSGGPHVRGCWVVDLVLGKG